MLVLVVLRVYKELGFVVIGCLAGVLFLVVEFACSGFRFLALRILGFGV